MKMRIKEIILSIVILLIFITVVIHIELVSENKKNDGNLDTLMINTYLNEYRNRLKACNAVTETSQQEIAFLTDTELSYFQSEGYDVDSKYAYDVTLENVTLYYPLLLSGKPAGVNQFGELEFGSRTYPWLHTAGLELKATPILKSAYYNVYYDKFAGVVQQWSYGSCVREAIVPTNSDYIGYNQVEGFLFLSGNTVLSVFDNKGGPDRKILAKDVEKVISASDRNAKPLFLMKDGSLKSYWSEIGNPNISDEQKKLISPDLGTILRFENLI